MFNLLHNFEPQPILVSLGLVNIYWYGLFMVLGILAAIAVSCRLAKRFGIASQELFDLAFWLIIFGLIGARLYDVCLELPYYLAHPGQILAIWRGGLAIHGAVIAGLATILAFSWKHRIGFWRLTASVVPGLALAQAIGRWGNYFNQELFGLPTEKPWGIFINPMNRPADYAPYQYFQPTFLYESLGDLLIFIILLLAISYASKKDKLNSHFFALLTALYMILYSILRFFLEYIRLDRTPACFGLRWPQIISLAIIIISSLIIIFHSHAWKKNEEKL